MVTSARGLERLIGRALTLTTLASMFLLSAGIMTYVSQRGELTLDLEDRWVLDGENVLSVLGTLSENLGDPPYALMAFGIIVLLLGQYFRVAMSMAYFSVSRDWKYVAITLVVLIVLTMSILGYIHH